MPTAPARPHRISLAALMAGGVIVLSGEVVPGVTCPAIRTTEGQTIALSHLPSTFQIGDRVTVTGSGYAPSASCMQEVLLVTEAKAAH